MKIEYNYIFQSIFIVAIYSVPSGTAIPGHGSRASDFCPDPPPGKEVPQRDPQVDLLQISGIVAEISPVPFLVKVLFSVQSNYPPRLSLTRRQRPT